MIAKYRIFLIALIFSLTPTITFAEDWPTWRHDAGRTASSVEELPDNLYLQWTKHYTEREQVWDDPLNNDLMQFDKIFEPIAVGNTLYIGFNDQDKVVALDSESGKELWAYYADGPVRLPITYYNNKIYFTSDDGFLYCLSAVKGELIWKFRGGPADRKMLGNKRLISTWPARGGVVIDNGTAYFAASIWPSMGTFIYALDAENGEEIWKNDGTSADYIKQPHSAYSFAGIAPQGTMAVNGNNLFIPGGRSVAGCFDKNTGEQNYYHINKYNKSGGAFVSTRDNWFVNHHRDRNTIIYETNEGNRVSKVLEKYPVLSKDLFYFSGESVVARDPKNPSEIVWKLEVDASGDLIQAGNRLYAGGKNSLTAIQLSNDGASIAWIKEVSGDIGRIIAANGKIFAVTMDGKILAFGASKPKSSVEIYSQTKPFKISKSAKLKADEIIADTKVKEGYALYFGGENYELLASLAQKTDLSFIAVVENSSKVNELRVKFDKMG
ncbi:MAG: PQQ-like beta-propeller repeat protein, partial [Cyclobacteriaceae bacterium]|nr:PQQ-like beta-propeller repeat protein [Cyclobacteriaceae bacterium]